MSGASGCLCPLQRTSWESRNEKGMLMGADVLDELKPLREKAAKARRDRYADDARRAETWQRKRDAVGRCFELSWGSLLQR